MSAGLTSLSVDVSQLDGVRRGLEGASRDMKQDLLDAIGAELESSTRRRIDEEKESPEGDAWAVWSPNYARTRDGQHSLLIGENELLDSIQYAIDGRGFVDLGSNLVYAATHQFGDPERNIPERPYLGVSSDDEAALEAAIADIVAASLAFNNRGVS